MVCIVPVNGGFANKKHKTHCYIDRETESKTCNTLLYISYLTDVFATEDHQFLHACQKFVNLKTNQNRTLDV